GSLEDLWGYNLESVARAIAVCSVPVVSAIGHESDFTIADFVADVRAPTPSAAAEIVFPEARALRLALQRDLERTHRALKRVTDYERQRLNAARHRLGDAKGALREWSQSIEHVRSRIDASMRASITARRAQLAASERALGAGHPRVRLNAVRDALDRARKRAETAWDAGLTQRRHRFRELGVTLRALSPLAVLERGYAIALDSNGEALRRGNTVELGSTVKVRLHEGSITAEVVDRDGGDTTSS
ncbi:MAG: exodeoxyribonuclease VII large subunit, partial [Myxococcota bacterium]